ncbi:MAG: hypothetical protein Q8K58_03920 [Acidimicrobiales bacterium]|nr:hypothetical protein [Acidimicrobiales bacterium]
MAGPLDPRSDAILSAEKAQERRRVAEEEARRQAEIVAAAAEGELPVAGEDHAFVVPVLLNGHGLHEGHECDLPDLRVGDPSTMHGQLNVTVRAKTFTDYGLFTDYVTATVPSVVVVDLAYNQMADRLADERTARHVGMFLEGLTSNVLAVLLHTNHRDAALWALAHELEDRHRDLVIGRINRLDSVHHLLYEIRHSVGFLYPHSSPFGEPPHKVLQNVWVRRLLTAAAAGALRRTEAAAFLGFSDGYVEREQPKAWSEFIEMMPSDGAVPSQTSWELLAATGRQLGPYLWHWLAAQNDKVSRELVRLAPWPGSGA